MKTCSSPTCSRWSSGTRLEHVARDQVKAARPRPQGDLPLDPHARLRYPRDAHVHALAAERHALGLEQRALAGALGQRPVGAHDPPPRHVLVGVGEHRPGEARRARARRRRRRARSPPACRGPAPARLASLSCPAMRHGTYSIVALDPATGELGVAVQSHWFSVGPLCAWARAGVGAVATQSVVEPAYGPNALDRLADGVGAQQALGELLAADPLAAVRQVAVIDVARRVSASTPAPDCIAARRPRDRRALELPGQHDGPRHRPGGDVGGVRERAGVAPGAAAGGARRRRGRGRRRARAPVGGDGRRARRGRAVAADGRPARRGLAGPARRAAPAADAPARLRPRRRRRRAAGRGPDRRGRRALPAGRRDRAPLGRAAVLVRPRPRAGRGPRRRRRRGPAGGRGEPELAGPPRPALTGVRAGRQRPCVSRSPEGGTSASARRSSHVHAVGRVRRRRDAERGRAAGGADRRGRERALRSRPC